jgi:hypothetical protein
LILSECQKHGLLRNETAYVLATAFWESARTMQPVREAFWLSEAWRKANLRYHPWYGRGFVQITWEANYVAMGNRLGIDLTSDPDVVMDPALSAQILVIGMKEGHFTGKKLSDYITLKASNYRGARRIVNGTDKAGAIAELAEEYEAALLAMGYGIDPVAPIANDRKDGTPPRKSPLQSTTNQAAGIAALSMIGSITEPVKTLVRDVTETFGISPQVALVLMALLALAWVSRERLRKWAEGDR